MPSLFCLWRGLLRSARRDPRQALAIQCGTGFGGNSPLGSGELKNWIQNVGGKAAARLDRSVV